MCAEAIVEASKGGKVMVGENAFRIYLDKCAALSAILDCSVPSADASLINLESCPLLPMHLLASVRPQVSVAHGQSQTRG